MNPPHPTLIQRLIRRVDRWLIEQRRATLKGQFAACGENVSIQLPVVINNADHLRVGARVSINAFVHIWALGGVTISQTAEARRRKIKALVYVCGLMPPSGKASREMTAGEPDMLFRRSREVSSDGRTYTFARAQLPALFYEDVSPEDRYRAMERPRPQPISISTTPVTLFRAPARPEGSAITPQGTS